MTTSRQPWTVQTANQDSNLNFILDANGKSIAWFYNWQDAELVISLQEEVNSLKSQLEEANDKLEELLEK